MKKNLTDQEILALINKAHQHLDEAERLLDESYDRMLKKTQQQEQRQAA